jgi:urease beta subunit
MLMVKIIKIVLIVALLYVPATILASELGIAVDQTAVVFDMDTEEKQEFVINVNNISKRRKEVFISSVDYQLGDNNNIHLTDNSEGSGIKDLVSAENESIWLEPGETKNVKFVANVFKDAVVGSHRGVAIFRVNSDQGNSVEVNGQVGVHILINVKGDTHATGQLNYFKVPFWSKGIVEYFAEFENTGNIHYVPYGEVVMHNPITNFEDKYKYSKHFTFPGRKFVFSHREEIPSLFGLYKVRSTFVDGEGGEHSKFGFVVGYLFPVICVGALIFFGYVIFRIILVKRKVL